MRTYVFDLDGTLCMSGQNYIESVPMFDRIQKVNDLKATGAKIVIYTARGMSTFHGFKFLAWLRWGLVTRKQLRLWGLAYDKLILGKPSGDIYVDDKAQNSEEFFC